MTEKTSFSDYICISILMVAAVFVAFEGKKRIEAEKMVQQSEQMEKRSRNMEKIRAKIAAWKARKAGLYGPRKVFLPTQKIASTETEEKLFKQTDSVVKVVRNTVQFYPRYSDRLFEKE